MVKIKKENEPLQSIQWAADYLLSNGYELDEIIPETIQHTSWSYVSRFITPRGYIYLKCTPEPLSLEVDVIRVLSQVFQVSVPEVIAHHSRLNCFLMNDAGSTLRSILKRDFDTDLVCNVMNQFTKNQLSIANKLNMLIDIGVPDWRLDKLPMLYQQLLVKKDILIEDGFSDTDIQKLNVLSIKVVELCEKLSSYAIKQSIVQPDFNDNNTLVNELSQQIIMIDVGELSISHPFFSLHNFLLQMKKHHGLTESDARYLRIRDAYLSNYMHDESNKRVRDAFLITRELFPIYCALSDERLMNACDKENLRSVFPEQGKPGKSLRIFLARNEI